MKAVLQFIGVQKGYQDIPSYRLYNVLVSPRPDLHPVGSTISDNTAIRLGWLDPYAHMSRSETVAETQERKPR